MWYIFVTTILKYTIIRMKNNGQLESCSFDKEHYQALEDALYVLGGKWKISVINSIYSGNNRFREIERSIPNITTRMLSKVLKELELNKLVNRTVAADSPVSVEYTLPEHSSSLKEVLEALVGWGMEHREVIRG